MDDQIVERKALALTLKLNPINSGVRQTARFTAREHLQKVESDQFALYIGSSAPAPDRAGAFFLILGGLGRLLVRRSRSSLCGCGAAHRSQ